ncbi:MAG: ribosome biogenesis factor YjgA [Pseudomonadota bacterium]
MQTPPEPITPQQQELEESELPSKSQLKRDMHELQKLGLKLKSLSPTLLNKLQLDEKLYDAIKLSHTIYSNSATKRHRQYIGKIISRLDDAEQERIKAQILAYENVDIQANKHFHQLEQYRDQLVKQGDDAINELISKHPHLDRTRLRQLIRNSQKEIDKQQPPKSARLLFKYLKENLEA